MLRDLSALGGKFGVFDDGESLLLRSLLWRRGAEQEELSRVDFTPEDGKELEITPPPSWSWMGYEGAVDYLDLPLGGVDWIEGAVQGPWSRPVRPEAEEATGLSAQARLFCKAPVRDDLGDVAIVLDAGGDEYARAGREWKNWACVVVGTRRVFNGANLPVPVRRHYILIVSPSRGGRYERVGVGYMPGRFISDQLPDQVIIN